MGIGAEPGTESSAHGVKRGTRAAEARHLHLQDERSGSASGPVDEFNAIVAGVMAGSTMSRRSRNAGSPALNQPDLFSLPGSTAVAHVAAPICEKPKSTATRFVPQGRMEASDPNRSPAPGAAPQSPLSRDKPPKLVHLLDVRAAAAWLGLSKSTLDKMRCYGVGPRFIRATGRAVRYDPADLAAFAAGRRQLRTTDEVPA